MYFICGKHVWHDKVLYMARTPEQRPKSLLWSRNLDIVSSCLVNALLSRSLCIAIASMMSTSMPTNLYNSLKCSILVLMYSTSYYEVKGYILWRISLMLVYFVNKTMPTHFIDRRCDTNELKSYRNCLTSNLQIHFMWVAIDSLGVDMHYFTLIVDLILWA